MAVGGALLTIEDYLSLPDDGRMTELVRGRIVEVPPTNQRHGQLCYRTARILGHHVDTHDLGHILINDSGIVTERDPDTLRGPDIAFYPYEKLPKGPLPGGYPTVAPDLIVEIRSPSDRWTAIEEKVAEYRAIGVLIVCVLDPGTQRIYVYAQDQPVRILEPHDELSFPEILGEFRVLVRQFFE